jgi:hypothetical protein
MRMQNTGITRFVLGLALLGAVAACGDDTGPATTTTTTVSPPTLTTTTTSTTTTSTTTPPPATTEGPETGAVRFVEAVPTKQWGDPPFEVKTETNSGLPVDYSSDGGCSVSGATVTIDSVGSCTIRANQAGNSEWTPSAATLTFTIERASPVISFEDQSVRFTRNLRVPLWAKSTPSIPLTYTLIQTDDTYNETPCAIDGKDFVFPDTPIPTLSARCAVRVEAASASANYVTPEPKTAIIDINFPSWDVAIDPLPDEIDFSDSASAITVTIVERSGNAYGMEVFASGSCTQVGAGSGTLFADPQPVAPRGTTQYAAEIILLDPTTVSFPTCTIEARAFPLDHVGGKGSDVVSFTVVP